MIKITTKLFIEKANIVHSNKYNYNETIYLKGTEKVSIICPTHGKFLQIASSHLSGRGCRKCFDKRHSQQYLLKKEDILKTFKKVHKNKYIYPKFIYTSTYQKINIICPIHGEFIQSIQSHKNKCGCPACSNVKPHTKESFIKEGLRVHGNKYDYSLVIYKNNNTKIKIICPEHGIFEQTPRSHLTYGCAKCHIRGYSKSKWIELSNKNNNSSLYIIKCWGNNEEFIKIGITTKTIKSRFKSKELPYEYTILKLITDSPENVWDKEKELHRLYKSFSYIPQLSFAGSTECFTLDVLNHL